MPDCRPPRSFASNRGEPLPERPLIDWLAEGPLFVKPASEDASLGIDHDSVVADWPRCDGERRTIADRFGAVLIERVHRRPRVQYRRRRAAGARKCFHWRKSSFKSAPANCAGRSSRTKANGTWKGSKIGRRQSAAPPTSSRRSAQAISETALRAFRLLGCRDYARVDLRVDRAGQIFILEVNANPDAGPRAGLAKALRSGGIEYDDFVRRVVATAAGPRNCR